MKVTHKKPTQTYARASLLLAAAILISLAQSGGAATFIKADNTTALNTSGSWTTAGVPGSGDTAQWDSTFEAINNSAVLGTNMTWAGIAVSNNLQAAFTVNATGTNALTIGAGGINMSNANQSLTINCPVFEGGNETWNVGSGQILTFGNTVNGGTSTVNNTYNLTITGLGGVVNFDGNYFDGGNQGQVLLINSNTTVNVNPGGTGSFITSKKFALGNNTGSATMNILSGTNSISPVNYLAMADNSSTATLNISGGQTTISNTTYPFVVGLKGTGVVNVASSVLVITPSTIMTFGSYTSSGQTGANGTLNINNGGTVIITNSTQYFALGNGGPSSYGNGYLNLNSGGTLVCGRNIIKNNSSAQGYVIFNGGTLLIETNSATFMQGLTAAIVSTNGAVIDDGGHGVTIAESLSSNSNLVTDGGLTKHGIGTLNLTGTNTYNGGTTVSAGTLGISAASGSALGSGPCTVAGSANLWVQAPNGPAALNSLTLNSGSSLLLDAENASPSLPFLAITNAFTPASHVTVNLTNFNVTATGVYPLMTYGTLNGGGVAAFVLGTTPVVTGDTLSLSNDAAHQTIDLVVAQSASILLWNGNISGSWDINGSANWQNGVKYNEVAGVGPVAQFDDTASGPNFSITLNTGVHPTGVIVNNSADTYSISGSGQIAGSGSLTKEGSGTFVLATANTYPSGTFIEGGTLQLGDGVTFNGSVVGGIVDNSALTIANPQPQTFNNPISGAGTLTISGAASLTLTATNSVSGNVAVESGTLVLNSGGVGGSTPVLGYTTNLSVFSGATLALNGANALGLSNNLAMPTVAVAGGGTLNTIGQGIHNIGNLTIGDSSAGGVLSGPGGIVVNGNITNVMASVANIGTLACNSTNLVLSGGSSLTVNNNLSFVVPSSTGTVMMGDPSAGPGTFTTAGNVTVYNSYLEMEYLTWNVDLGTNVMNIYGKVTIGKIPGLPAYLEWNSGNGLIAVNNFFTIADAIGNNNQSVGELDVNGGNLVISNNTSRCLIGNAGTATIDVSGGSLSFMGNNTIQLGGDSSYPQNGASGTITIGGSGSMIVGPQSGGLRLAADKGTFTGITGTINLNGGTLTTWPGIVSGATGSGASYINFNGGTLKAGTNNATFLQGLTQAAVSSNGAKIDDGGNLVTIGQGLITDPNLNGATDGGLTKLGAGTLILTNNSSYTGATIVSNGTLEVNGGLTASPITVANGGTLSGVGTLGAAVTISVGGTLAPGDNAPGVLAINSDLTLSGSLAIAVNKSLVRSNSAVTVSGGLNNTGTGVVIITNSGPALAAGDVFTLFNEPVLNGAALSVSGGGAGVVWTNLLAVNGSVRVLSTTPPINPLPGTIQVSPLGNDTLSLAWPTNGGWILQAQTNAASVGLSTNWTAVSGSTSVTNTTVTINVTNGAVFYRMVHP
jgi:autotransporter-associated beta strand protein